MLAVVLPEVVRVGRGGVPPRQPTSPHESGTSMLHTSHYQVPWLQGCLPARPRHAPPSYLLGTYLIIALLLSAAAAGVRSNFPHSLFQPLHAVSGRCYEHSLLHPSLLIVESFSRPFYRILPTVQEISPSRGRNCAALDRV